MVRSHLFGAQCNYLSIVLSNLSSTSQAHDWCSQSVCGTLRVLNLAVLGSTSVEHVMYAVLVKDLIKTREVAPHSSFTVALPPVCARLDLRQSFRYGRWSF